MESNSSLRLIDTHCHLNLDIFDHDRNQVVENAKLNGVIKLLIPGIDIDTSLAAIRCTKEFDNVYSAVGVHPNNGQSWTINTPTEIKALASDHKVVAIGEIGLDYYRDSTARAFQRSIFTQQLELAAELELPVIIHNRDASQDVLSIIKIWHNDLMSKHSLLANNPGVMHSFTGDLPLAEAFISLNFKIGVDGPVTYKKSESLQNLIKSLNLDDLLIETDAPYLTPHPFRGKRNEPSNVRIVAEKIAEIKNIPLFDVAVITTDSADKLFNWRKSH